MSSSRTDWDPAPTRLTVCLAKRRAADRLDEDTVKAARGQRAKPIQEPQAVAAGVSHGDVREHDVTRDPPGRLDGALGAVGFADERAFHLKGGGRTHSGLALWFLGYPRSAVERSRAGMALATELAHVGTVVNALPFAGLLH